MLYLNRLNFIEKLEQIIEDHEKTHYSKVINVSGWQSNDEYCDLILKKFSYENKGNYLNYVYSYNIPLNIKEAIKFKLGAHSSYTIHFTQNNTISIILAANFAKKIGLKKIGVLSPFYFSIRNSFIEFGLNIEEIPMERNDGIYYIPQNIIEKKNYDMLIITDPVFCTGQILSNKCTEYIKNFLRKGKFLLSDECLNLSGNEWVRKTEGNIIAIYSPHKLISLNGFKFSCLIFPKKYEKFFNQWEDIFSGNMSLTNENAIYHYLSNNYNILYNDCQQHIEFAKENIVSILKNYSDFYLDPKTSGGYICVYNKKLSYKKTKTLSFFKQLIRETDSLFMHSFLHGFSKEIGFCFRLNLFAYNNSFKISFIKILNYLSKLLNIY